MPQSQGVFGGFLWLARRDARLVFSAANSLGKVGVFSWDGTNLTTLLAPAQDLPGLLGPIQQALSLKFDGTTVVLQANDSVQIQGNNRQGIFRYTAAAGWTEIANATQPLPGNPSTAHKIFNGVDVANGTVFFTSGPSLGYQLYAADAVGGPRFVGPSASADLVTAQFSAASPLQAYLRNPPNLELVGNGLSDRVLGVGETLDGKKVSGVLDVDSQGNDLVVTLEFEDASTAVYAALGAPVSTVPLVLNSPVFVQGAMQFTLATRAGVQYGVEFKTSFGDPAWTPWRTINGDGNPQTVSISTSTTAAFFRVVELAP
jgi:hypothetical protein